MARERRPKNLTDAKRLIRETFRYNCWDADEVNRYLKMIGFRDTNWQEFSTDDLKKILADFEKNKMILFEDGKL